MTNRRNVNIANRYRRRRLRPLQFDSLEDRRLLAGLNVLVFDDVNGSLSYEAKQDKVVADRVVFVDLNLDSVLNANEPFGISGADGYVHLTGLKRGLAQLTVLGQPSATVQLTIGSVDEELSHNLAVATKASNRAPVWKSDKIGVNGTEDQSLSISTNVLAAKLTDLDNDSIYYFVTSPPTHGSLNWSLADGGTYVPDKDYDGNDSITVRAYDGKAWSEPATITVRLTGVDDLPTGLNVQWLASVNENEPGALLGTYQIADIDGGEASFYLTPNSLVVASNGEIRLDSRTSLNYEEGTSISVSIAMAGDFANTSAFTSSGTISVNDRNDLSTGVEFGGDLRVEEFRRGHNFGYLRVIDEDRNEQFDWTVSDNRFFVDAQNNLRLADGVMLQTRLAKQIDIKVTATSQSGGDSIDTNLQISVEVAPPPYQNQSFPLDVDQDGVVTQLDVLAVINAINARGVADLSGPPPEGSFNYIDVNGDRVLTPLDVLVLINYLNNHRRGSGNGSGGGSGGSGSGPEGEAPANNQLRVAVVQPQPIVSVSKPTQVTANEPTKKTEVASTSAVIPTLNSSAVDLSLADYRKKLRRTK